MPRWTKEIFVIDEIKKTNPITYKIKDLNGEPILGSFYIQELQKKQNSKLDISMVARHMARHGYTFLLWLDISIIWLDIGFINKIVNK